MVVGVMGKRVNASDTLLIEFLTNVVGQHTALGCPLRLKSRVVFFDQLENGAQRRGDRERNMPVGDRDPKACRISLRFMVNSI